MLRRRLGECLAYLGNEAGPVAGGGLAEETQGGVPGGVGAGGLPAPVGGVLEEEPGGFAEGSGEVGGEGVDGDNEVEVGDGGGERGDAGAGDEGLVGYELGEAGELGAGFASLEVPELDTREGEEWGEADDGDGAGGVPFAGGPYQADARRGFGAYAAGGPGEECLRKVQVAGSHGEAGGLGAEEVGEFHDFYLDVKGGRMGGCLVAPGDDVVYAGKAGCELEESGGDFVDDRSCELLEHGGVAEHLDGVAVAVEGADDEACAGEGLAVPEAVGVGEAAGADGVAELPGGAEVAGAHGLQPVSAVAMVQVCVTGRHLRLCAGRRSGGRRRGPRPGGRGRGRPRAQGAARW